MSDEMQRELSTLKNEFSAFRSEVKEEFSAVREQFSAVHEEFTAVRAEMKEGDRRIAVEVARLNAKVDSLELRMATKDDIGLILQRFDAFLPSFEANRRERDFADKVSMRHQDRLDDHEARIARLEQRKKS